MADLRGRGGRASPLLGFQILSISCSFWGNLAKSYVGAPLWGVGAPSSGKSWIRHWFRNYLSYRLVLCDVTPDTKQKHDSYGLVSFVAAYK